MRTGLYLILAAAITWMGCAPQKAATQAPVLQDGSWTLQRMEGETPAHLKKPITLNILTAEKRATGYAGCNQFFSSYTVQDGSINFSSPGRTKMYCSDSMETEEKFIALLERVNRFTREGDQLTLSEGETVLLEFVK